MGKRITQQARGKGSLTFKVRPRAYRYKIQYPALKTSGKAKKNYLTLQHILLHLLKLKLKKKFSLAQQHLEYMRVKKYLSMNKEKVKNQK